MTQVSIRAYSHRAKAKNIEELTEKIKKIPVKHDRKFSLSLSLLSGLNGP